MKCNRMEELKADSTTRCHKNKKAPSKENRKNRNWISNTGTDRSQQRN